MQYDAIAESPARFTNSDSHKIRTITLNLENVLFAITPIEKESQTISTIIY